MGTLRNVQVDIPEDEQAPIWMVTREYRSNVVGAVEVQPSPVQG